jgi:hypothetical protein
MEICELMQKISLGISLNKALSSEEAIPDMFLQALMSRERELT